MQVPGQLGIARPPGLRRRRLVHDEPSSAPPARRHDDAVARPHAQHRRGVGEWPAVRSRPPAGGRAARPAAGAAVAPPAFAAAGGQRTRGRAPTRSRCASRITATTAASSARRTDVPQAGEQQDRAGRPLEVPRRAADATPVRCTRSQASSRRTSPSPPAAASRAPRGAASSRSHRAAPDVVVRLGVSPGEMKFDQAELTVAPGQLVEIVFTNPDAMQHNFVLGSAGLARGDRPRPPTMLAQTPDGPAQQYVPQIPQVLFSTKLVEPGRNGDGPVQGAVRAGPVSIRLHVPWALARDERHAERSARRRDGAGEAGSSQLNAQGSRLGRASGSARPTRIRHAIREPELFERDTYVRQDRVAIVGLGFGAEFIPIYQRHPNAEMYAICRRDEKELDACGDQFGIKTRYTELRGSAEGPERRRRPHQLADRRPRAAVDRRAQGRQARRQHGADGHDDRRVPADRRSAAQERQGLHDDGDRRLQPRVPVRRRSCTTRASSAGSSSCAAATSRTWTAGRATGKAFRRCTTRRTASARAWRILGKHAEHVVCHGSGRIDEALIPKYGSPFAIETATFKLRDSDVVRRGHAQPVRHRPAVPRELRRLRLEEVVRVAAGRERGAGHPHARARAGSR